MPAVLVAPSLTLRVPPAASGFRPSYEASAYGQSEKLSRSHRQVRPFVGWSGRLIWPLLTPLPPSRHLTMAVAQRHAKRSPRVKRATFIPYTRRIYFSTFPGDYRASGLFAPSPRWSCPGTRLRVMRFVFLGPGLCVPLPSDSTSRWTPLRFGSRFPSPGLVEDLHLQVSGRAPHLTG